MDSSYCQLETCTALEGTGSIWIVVIASLRRVLHWRVLAQYSSYCHLETCTALEGTGSICIVVIDSLRHVLHGRVLALYV